jgi:hypothetical protein
MQNSIDATIRNLSTLGVGLESTSELPETLLLRASLGQDVQSVLQLKVKNRQGNTYGCEIVSCDQQWVDFMSTISNADMVLSKLRAS